nr:ORF2 [Arabidopsis thaliana]
MLLPVGI